MYKKRLPEIVILVEKLQDIRLFDTEAFEFYIDYREQKPYHCCPIDSIPFAFTGHNGIHFAFITDFKKTYDFNDLPIICIAPSYDPCVNYVSKNIKDFFSVLTTIHSSTILANEFKTKEDYNKVEKEYLESYRNDLYSKKELTEMASFIRKKFSLELVDNVYEYLSKIKEERISTVETYSNEYSRLGINSIDKQTITVFDQKSTAENIAKFLESNNRSSRLQLYRDCTSRFSISGDNNVELRNVFEKYLMKDGYIEIANRIKQY